MIQKAIELARQAHKGQKRKDGTPYVSHPLAVAKILKYHGFGEKVQIAGILHDLYEDTPINDTKLTELFGSEIAFLVYALSKNKKPKSTYKKSWEIIFGMYLRRFLNFSKENPIVLYVKMADQIHNLSTMQAFTEEKKQRKCNEVTHYFLSIYENCENIPEQDIEGFNELLSHLKRVLTLDLPGEDENMREVHLTHKPARNEWISQFRQLIVLSNLGRSPMSL